MTSNQKTKRFTEEDFSATKWHTAKEKALWINGMIAFIEQGFEFEKWRKGLYRHLYQLFGHMAHYDQLGFYDEWFASCYKQLEWLTYIAKGGFMGGWFSGSPRPDTWDDVERALITYVHEYQLVEKYQRICAETTERRERAHLALLQEKYGPDSSTTAPVPASTQQTITLGEASLCAPPCDKTPRAKKKRGTLSTSPEATSEFEQVSLF